MPERPVDNGAPTTREQDRRLVLFFCSWIGVGLLGNLVLVVVGRPDKLDGGFIMVGIGVLMLLSYGLYRRGRSRRGGHAPNDDAS